jgi:hypothetical protein
VKIKGEKRYMEKEIKRKMTKEDRRKSGRKRKEERVNGRCQNK